MKRLAVILLPLLLAACNVIDDDLSVCGEELVIDYQVQLHTELSVQLQTELTAETETPVREALEKWLAPIFTDKAKDVDLRFYSGQTDNMRHQIQERINDNRTSYTIRLPKEDYMHLAVANIEDNRQVHLSGGEHSATMYIGMPASKEAGSLNTGVFTARLPMQVNDTTKRFEVHLYMITAAVALVIDTTGCGIVESVEGCMLGSACGFSVCDSVFAYTSQPEILFENVPMGAGSNLPARQAAQAASSHLCLATVGLATKDDSEWEVVCTANLSDNKHTTTTLTVSEPLEAGTLRIIKAKMNPDGGLTPANPKDIGATVVLDWKQGGEHEVDL